MTRSFQSAVREAQKLKQQHQQQSEQLQGLRSKLYDAGISTKNLGTHERQLREQINATNASISTQGKRMAELSAQPPYAARGQRNTFNSEDNIYNDLLLLDVSQAADGYATTFNIGLDLG